MSKILNVKTRLVVEIINSGKQRTLKRLTSSCGLLHCEWPQSQCNNCRFCDMDIKKVD